MKILLDKSPKQLTLYSNKYKYDFWQFRSPLTSYRLSGKPYGLDNGCFTQFKYKIWRRMVEEAYEHEPIFVCLPDIVGNAKKTLELFETFKTQTIALPRALVLQDGINNYNIPWTEIDAIFIGGSDKFKISNEAINAAKSAKILNKWVHVGRVNSALRVRQWYNLADSIDGSGISRYDHTLETVLTEIRKLSI